MMVALSIETVFADVMVHGLARTRVPGTCVRKEGKPLLAQAPAGHAKCTAPAFRGTATLR